jgi:hypothetical protein
MERFLDRPNVEHPVFDECVVRFLGVVLQLVIAPTANPLVRVVVVESVTDVEVPVRAIDIFPIEFVVPNQSPRIRRRFRSGMPDGDWHNTNHRANGNRSQTVSCTVHLALPLSVGCGGNLLSPSKVLDRFDRLGESRRFAAYHAGPQASQVELYRRGFHYARLRRPEPTSATFQRAFSHQANGSAERAGRYGTTSKRPASKV